MFVCSRLIRLKVPAILKRYPDSKPPLPTSSPHRLVSPQTVAPSLHTVYHSIVQMFFVLLSFSSQAPPNDDKKKPIMAVRESLLRCFRRLSAVGVPSGDKRCAWRDRGSPTRRCCTGVVGSGVSQPIASYAWAAPIVAGAEGSLFECGVDSRKQLELILRHEPKRGLLN